MQPILKIAISFFITFSMALAAGFTIMLAWSCYRQIDADYFINALEAMLIIAAAHFIPASLLSYLYSALQRTIPAPAQATTDMNDGWARLKNGAALIIQQQGTLTTNEYKVVAEWHLHDTLSTFKAAVYASVNVISTHHAVDKALLAYAAASQPPHGLAPTALKTGRNSLVDGTIQPYSDHYRIVLKGDVETILAMTAATESEREKALLRAHQWESEGYHTMAVCNLTSDRLVSHVRELSYCVNGELVGVIALHNKAQPNIARIIHVLRQNTISLHIVTSHTIAATQYHANKLLGARQPYSLIDCSATSTISRHHLPVNPDICWYANATKKDAERIIDLLSEQGDIMALNDYKQGYEQLRSAAAIAAAAPLIRRTSIVFRCFILSYVVQLAYTTTAFIIDALRPQISFKLFWATLSIGIALCMYVLLRWPAYRRQHI